MANDSEQPRPLETASTEEIINELARRHLGMAFIGISQAVESPDMANWRMRYKGDEYHLIGLLFEAQHQLRRFRSKGGSTVVGGGE